MGKLERKCKCGEMHTWEVTKTEPSNRFDTQDLEELIGLVGAARGEEVVAAVLRGRPTDRLVALTSLETKLIVAKATEEGEE